jgi:uncharacterized LabA/DUF88 family protein
MVKTAILVDGGFYRKRAMYLWGKVDSQKRANELVAYCRAHINDTFELKDERYLYRIFYYVCPPLKKKVYHPLLKTTVDFEKSETFAWTTEFFNALKEKRKVALRLGELSDERAGFDIKQDILRKLYAGTINMSDIAESDFSVNFSQKGVDMRIGLDIASLSFKKQVDQIILISGDSDFVPAAKLARREGIDFILDPMWSKVKASLLEHIDGLKSQWKKK